MRRCRTGVLLNQSAAVDARDPYLQPSLWLARRTPLAMPRRRPPGLEDAGGIGSGPADTRPTICVRQTYLQKKSVLQAIQPTASPQQSPVTESLALGRPQIPGQLSASVRPGGSLTEAKCWAVRFPVGRGRPAPTRPSKNQIDCRKVVVGALRVHWPLRHASPNECRAEAPPERGCWHIGYFAGMT
jgi:hypothetical protein